jgi:PAS domain S-box-containing protein
MLFTPEAVASGAADKELEIAAKEGSANDDRWISRKNGERFWASGITTGVRDEVGELIGFTKVLRDLTERKRYEERLRESQLYLRLLTETMPQLVWSCRADGECDYLSPQWARYTGVPESEHFGFGWFDQLHPDDRGRALTAWNNAVKRSHIYDMEFRIRRADGNYRWFKSRALPLRSEEGAVIKWFGTNTDMEDQKRIEALLRENEELLRTDRDFSYDIIDTLPGVFYLFDRQGKFLRWNKNLEEISGHSEVITTTGALQALDALASEKMDVLVSDINMPEMDGYELIRRVRAMKPEEGGRIPAVALTAYSRAEDRLRALQSGFQTHVPKPVEPAELEVVVATLAKSFKGV